MLASDFFLKAYDDGAVVVGDKSIAATSNKKNIWDGVNDSRVNLEDNVVREIPKNSHDKRKQELNTVTDSTNGSRNTHNISLKAEIIELRSSLAEERASKIDTVSNLESQLEESRQKIRRLLLENEVSIKNEVQSKNQLKLLQISHQETQTRYEENMKIAIKSADDVRDNLETLLKCEKKQRDKDVDSLRQQKIFFAKVIDNLRESKRIAELERDQTVSRLENDLAEMEVTVKQLKTKLDPPKSLIDNVRMNKSIKASSEWDKTQLLQSKEIVSLLIHEPIDTSTSTLNKSSLFKTHLSARSSQKKSSLNELISQLEASKKRLQTADEIS